MITARTYPDTLPIRPLENVPDVTLSVPGSKSLTNRALILAALADGVSTLRGVLDSEDTRVMQEALRQLGIPITMDLETETCIVHGQGGNISAGAADLFLGNSGTSIRFLTALAALGKGRYRLDGVARMRERPQADLLDALADLGVSARSERGNGCPPLVVEGAGKLPGGVARLRAEASSQFLSALLMVAPYAARDVTIEARGRLRPFYVDITRRMMAEWGVQARMMAQDRTPPSRLSCSLAAREERGEEDLPPAPLPEGQGNRSSLPSSDEGAGHYSSHPLPLRRGGPEWGNHSRGQEVESVVFSVAAGQRYAPQSSYPIEPDASSASYFFAAAAITGGRVTVAGLGPDALQGDARFATEVLAEMGCGVTANRSGLTVVGPPPGQLRGVERDMSAISDTSLTLAAIAPFANTPTIVRNIAHTRLQECDRIAAVCAELARLGIRVEERPDGFTVYPAEQFQPATVHTYGDHRVAMSFALVGLRVPGVTIENPACVAKTFPDYWERLEWLRG